MNGRIALLTLVLRSPLGPRAGQAEIHFQAPDHGDYVGTRACAECHRPEFDAWQGSQHDRAMQPATAETVLGDFDDARFDYYRKAAGLAPENARYAFVLGVALYTAWNARTRPAGCWNRP